ncbi:restriction endonuclease subunit S [Treponema pectinovorum]|uniref:restriction endonuclease subunit S n=1 Tax=Treponema pectinovorum TaxID=164 RepID=UPI00164D9669|nr:restriction endonuclease subunit S [Treponema pectinovorum]
MPEGWAWCRLGEIVEVSSAKRVLQQDWKKSGIPFYRAREIAQLSNNEKVIDDLFITSQLYSELKLKYGVPIAGDLMVSAVGTIGKIYIVKDTDCFYYKDASVICFSKKEKNIDSLYLKFCCETDFLQEQMYSQSKGTTVDTITINKAQNYLIPLPPISEQKKIVDSVQKFFSHIDILEHKKSELKISIKQAKSKILDLAIRGKIVPQNPNDESAEELLKRIATSDNRPYKKFEGEDPFEIPDSWAWCTGNDIFNPMTSKKPYGETFRYIDIDAIDNKKHCVIQPKTIAVSEAPSRASRELNNGDVLFSLVRPYLENIALIEKENTDCIASTGFYVCKPKDFIFPKFLFYLMTSEYVIKGLNQFMKGDNSPSINGDDIKNWLYPLPSLAEQQRIVTKIEELFAQLDSISEQLA